MRALSRMGIGLGLLLFLVSQASAGIIVAFGGRTPTPPEPGPYTFSYNAELEDRQRIVAGDFFTIFDFGGYIAGSATAPAGWSFSTTGAGPVPLFVGPQDDSFEGNLTWTYTGDAAIIGPSVLGTFTAQTLSPLLLTDHYAAEVTRHGGLQDGNFISNLAFTTVPGPSLAIPEPAIAGMLALAAAAMLLRRRAI